jgi:hypothetical protein
MPLFGRDAHLDNILTAYRYFPYTKASQEDLLGAAEALLAVVDRIPEF